MLKLSGWVFLIAISIMGLKWSNPNIISAFNDQEQQSQPISSNSPYYIKFGPKKTATISLKMQYTPGQNSVFIIDPMPTRDWRNDTCIEKLLVSGKTVNKKPICWQRIIDLGPYLQDGINPVALQLRSKQPATNIFFSPELYGPNWPSSIACLGLLAAAAALLFYIGQRMGLDLPANLILVMALPYFCYWLHFFPNFAYTADIPGHLYFTLYMINNWMRPFDYGGHENFHPPLYYLLTSRVFILFRNIWPINAITVVRAASIAIYMIFCLYGVRTLKLASSGNGLAYYVGCLLIVFWPAAILKVTNINDDIPIYALWGASFYYLTRWFHDRRISGLQIAVSLTGVMFMVKSNAYVPGGIIAICALYELYRKRLAWRQLFERRSLIAGSVLIAGILVNFSRFIYIKFFHGRSELFMYFGGQREDVHDAAYFLHFNIADYVNRPFVAFNSEPAYLNFFLKSALYNEYPWAHPGILQNLPLILNLLLVMLLVVIIYATVATFINARQTLDSAWPHLVSVVLCVLSSIGFTIIDRYVFCQNFRYVLPMLVPLVILWLRGMETARETPTLLPLYWLGMEIAILLPLGAIFLYLEQYLRMV